jgi:hypothetical protein
MVHGYVACADIVTGDIPHECHLMTTPHRLHVCVLKRHTLPRVYAELARLADEQRTFSFGCQPIGIRTFTPPTAKGL